MRPSTLSVLLFALISQGAPLDERAANPTVTISNGAVVGTATGVLNQPSVTGQVNAFLGVPFAKSPPLRFAPPEAAQPWSTPLVAQKLPPACLQQFPTGASGDKTREVFNNPGYAPPAESEDCLYLNVFAPQDASPTNLKPVMFWLFGGNNQFGTASLGYYNGSSLAVNEDVVVVVINYRTNMFGFSSSPQIPFGQQNSGYLDQRFALQWVQQNIKQFGGDPSKVTLFGESAGGHGIKQLLAQPPSPLPYRAAIMESENLNAAGNGLVSYNQVLANFGCTVSTDQLACIRKVSGTAIQKYISDNGLAFPPVQGDGTSMGANTLPSILSGKFANVPILIGSNFNEATVFLYLFGLGPGVSVLNDTLKSSGLALPSSAVLNSTYGQVTDLASRVLTDLLFTCTTRSFSNAINNAGRQPVWRYRYDGSFPNLQFGLDLKAYHSSEIPEVWGTYPLSNQYGQATSDEINLSKYMQHAWANFAKNPSGGPGWPKLGSNGGVELGILGGKNNTAGEYTAPLITSDYPCYLYEPALIAAGAAY